MQGSTPYAMGTYKKGVYTLDAMHRHGVTLTLQRQTVTVTLTTFSSYRAENTLGFGYKTQSVQAEERNNPCLSRDHTKHTNTMRKQNAEFLNVKPGGI
jgi:hypothetical protein